MPSVPLHTSPPRSNVLAISNFETHEDTWQALTNMDASSMKWTLWLWVHLKNRGGSGSFISSLMLPKISKPVMPWNMWSLMTHLELTKASFDTSILTEIGFGEETILQSR